MKWSERPPKYGDMIRVAVRFYHHYGIYADDNTVIQFGQRDNTGVPPESIQILVTDINTFSAGSMVERAELSPAEKHQRHSPQKTVEYALSRVGETGYHILHNNCEHFANQCIFGEARSHFLDRIRKEIREKL